MKALLLRTRELGENNPRTREYVVWITPIYYPHLYRPFGFEVPRCLILKSRLTGDLSSNKIQKSP